MKVINFYTHIILDGKQQFKGAGEQWMPMIASPPTPARTASTATAMAAAPGARTTTCRHAGQKTIHLTRRRLPPRARDKSISVRKVKGCQIWYPRHQNVSIKGVLDIKLYIDPDKCPNDVRTQFWRQNCVPVRASHARALAPKLCPDAIRTLVRMDR